MNLSKVIKRLGLLIIISGLCNSIWAQEFISLWDNNMPNSKGMKLEKIEARERITQVATPGIYRFVPSAEENNGTAVLICPPGGYHKLTYQIAGFQLAKWFNTIGINAFVLMYRLPTSPDLNDPKLAPLQDAQRAMQVIRANAEKWHINVDKIGVMGCSAGGHVAASLSTFTEDVTNIKDSIGSNQFIPNFQILISSVITMSDYTHKGSKEALLGENPDQETIDQFSCELKVTDMTPMAFIVHASNDNTVPPINSILYYQALLKNNVPSSLHIFPKGGHSIALRNNPGSTNLWSVLCEEWLRESDLLNQ